MAKKIRRIVNPRKLSAQQLEQDQREPSLSIAARLAGVLHIPLEELAGTVETA